MIDLTDDDVAEFRALYRRVTGRDLTPEQAREYAANVVNLVALAHRAEPGR